MKLLINISNNIGGGSFQVAHSFINECKKYTENNYIIAVNSKVYNLFSIHEFPKNFIFICVQNEHFFTLEKKMKKIENNYKPDVVFTLFGPAYWRPKVAHIVGFANPYYILLNEKSTNILKKCFNKKQLFLIKLKKMVHLAYMNRDADAIISETNYCLEEFLKIFKKIKYGFTVSNTCSTFFDNLPEHCRHEKFTLLTLSKYYKHKNLEIINEICFELNKRNIHDICFYVTIDKKNYERLFKDNTYVTNIGYVAPKDCPKVYAKSDVMFLPTLAECFSASYPEAMKSKIPILTSDLQFAHSICKDAALYFNPFDAMEIVEQIILLKNNKELYKSLVQKGNERIKNFNTAELRCRKYLEICSEIKNKNI